MRKREEEATVQERLHDFLIRHRRGGIVLALILVAAILGAAIFDSMNKSRKVESAEAAEEIQELYEDWKEEDEDQRDTAGLEERVQEILENFSGDFAGQRALFIQGQMALEQEQWEEAALAFESLASQWPQSYLAPVGLFNAGSAQEAGGMIDEALRIWNKLLEDYGDTAPDIPETLFNLARLTEGKGDREGALVFYKDLESRFPGSRWTNLAKNRILHIEN